MARQPMVTRCPNCDHDSTGSDTPREVRPFCSDECRAEYEAATARIVAEDVDADR